MTNPEQESDVTGGIDRRTLLKGTAAAGVAGSALSGSASAHENEILFRSVSDERFEYQVTVTGGIERGDWTEPGLDKVGKNTAKGWASGGGGDDFLFSGKIKDLDLEGPGKVFVNGDLIRDTTQKEKKRKKKLPNTITIEGQDRDVNYKFRVGGRVEKGDDADSGDRILDSDVVRGAVVEQGTDNFHYSGSLVFDSADGPLRVCLDLNDP